MGYTPEQRRDILAGIAAKAAADKLRAEQHDRDIRARRRAQEIWADDNGLSLAEYDQIMRSHVLSPQRPGGSGQVVRGAA